MVTIAVKRKAVNYATDLGGRLSDSPLRRFCEMKQETWTAIVRQEAGPNMLHMQRA